MRRGNALPLLSIAIVLAACGSSPATTMPADVGAQPAAPSMPVVAPLDGRKRNILLIIADDFGLDLSPCHPVGTDKPRMPNLERMCADGLVFDTVWASPLCTPTRATLLTGQYGFRTNVVQVLDVLQDTDSVMDGLARTDSDYANAIVGKWHLTDTDPVDPNAPARFGVQHYAGFLGGYTDDFYSWDYVEDGTLGHSDTYTTTWMTNHALAWIDQQGDRPWFLWLAENEPHFPFHLPPATLQHETGLTGDGSDIDARPREYVKAQSEALDTELGRLLASMDPQVRAATTVIFVGDNGTDPDVAADPYTSAHAKFSVYEGGIRVPLVISGAGVSRRGQREDALINAVDIPATVLSLAGAGDTRFHDGQSFASALTDDDFTGRDHLYMDAIRAEPFSGRPGWAVRDANWKLIEYDDGARELYDMRSDIAEQHDLAAHGVPTELQTEYEALDAYGQGVRRSAS